MRNSSVLTVWRGGGDWFLGFCCDLDLVGCCLLWVSMVGGLKKEMGEIGAVSDLKKSFHLALRPLLTACSNQVISFFLFIN